MIKSKYKKLRISSTETIDEHRYLIEQYLERKLDSCEIVHHIDGNSHNNCLENLDICLLSEHTKIHKTGEPLSPAHIDKIKWTRILTKLTRELSCYKICYACKSILPFSSFTANKSQLDLINSLCKNCRKQQRSKKSNTISDYL